MGAQLEVGGIMHARFAVVALLLTLAATACGSDNGITETPYDGPLLGTWIAVTLDGDSLPVQFEAPTAGVTCVYTVRSIEFTFLASGRYSGKDDVSARCGTATTEVDLSRNFAGRFRTVANILFLTEDNGVEQSSEFAISGDRLAITAFSADASSTTVLRRR
jgi:hypothetical protein